MTPLLDAVASPLPAVSRRTLLTAGTATVAALGAGVLVPDRARAATAVRRRTIAIGRSVEGRTMECRIIGDPEQAATRVLMHGSIHGNEDDGIAVVRKLWNATPPEDTCFLIVPTTNPDGNRHGTRNNARGVNLGRNFPGGERGGRPGDQSYAGRANLSEPESQALHKIILGTEPTAAVFYHQHMNLIDYCGGNKRAQARYAEAVGMRFTQITRYRGSVATWLHAVRPSCTVMTVELSARTTNRRAGQHANALLGFARYLAAVEAAA